MSALGTGNPNDIKVSGSALLIIGAAALGLYVWYKRKAVIAAVDPTNPNNLANQAANGAFQAVNQVATGDGVDSIGTWIYGLLHPYDGAGFADYQPPTSTPGILGVIP